MAKDSELESNSTVYCVSRKESEKHGSGSRAVGRPKKTCERNCERIGERRLCRGTKPSVLEEID